MEQNLLTFFKELGFTDNETKVYLSLVDLGQTTIGPISAKAKIQPTKAYIALEKLVDNGLVSYVHKSNSKHFQMSDPETVLQIIREREEKAKFILPLLKQKQKVSGQQWDAEVYDGKAAVRTMYDSLITKMEPTDFYYSFALKKEYPYSDSAQLFFRQKHQLLAEKGIDDRLIVHEDVHESFMKIFGDIPGINVCFVKTDYPLGLAVTKNAVINLIWRDQPTAVEIRSSALAEQYKKFFLQVWEKHCTV